MESLNNESMTIESTIQAPVKKVWEYWTADKHIKNWNHASEDWHTTKVENYVKIGGDFLFRMEAKDGSFGFDLKGTYDRVEDLHLIAYALEDGRKVKIDFVEKDVATKVVETFEAESENPIEMQRNGWQAILNNFKKYVEEN